MRHLVALLMLAVAGSACAKVQPQAELAPIQLETARTPAAVVNAAAQHLTAQGFDLVTSDADAGLLAARRTQTPERWGALVRCGFGTSTAAHKFGQAAYTVTVAASPTAGGSAVTLRGRVRMSYKDIPGIPTAMTAPDSDTDCVSTGVVEQQLAAAVRG